MSSSPLPIRRAGPNDKLSASAKEALIATPSGHMYGSTPGGSRIVYSREQLLSLASSPLSQTPPHIPAEISRSPEKSSLLGQAAANRSNGISGLSPASEVFGGGSSNGHSNGGTRTANGASTIPRSPPANSSRSPGNAFNFAAGPVSPNGMTQSTSFKERLAAAHLQQQQQPARLQGQKPQGQSPTGTTTGNPAEGVNGDEQFNMEM